MGNFNFNRAWGESFWRLVFREKHGNLGGEAFKIAWEGCFSGKVVCLVVYSGSCVEV